MIITILGNLIVGGLVAALAFMLYAAGREMLGIPLVVAESSDDQEDEPDSWADTDAAYQRWIDRQFGL